MSNSTAPAYQTGDVVLLDKHLDFSTYKVGDAILYQPPDFSRIVIHKIYDIKIVNGTYYFAIKGDDNPQPDTVPQSGNITNELLANKTVTWSTFYNGQNTTNPTAKYIVASYYPAKEVVLGKVIYKIPLLGWIFVPFQSPNDVPLPGFSISFFSLISVYFVILIVASFFVLMYKANSELKKLLNSLTISPVHHWKPEKFRVTYFYSLVLYPLIFFGLLFLLVNFVPLTINTQIDLQSSSVQHTNNTTTTKLVYFEQTKVDSLDLHQYNTTKTTILLKNNSNLLTAYMTKDSINSGQNSKTGNPFYQVMNESYTLQIDPKSMFVEHSSKPNVPELGLFFNYIVPITPNQNPVGLMTQNVFLKASKTTYANQSAFETKLDFSFVQDLTSYSLNVHAYFNETNGYLIHLQNIVSQTWWIVPEFTGLSIIAIFSVTMYNVFIYEFEKLFNEKKENIIKAQLQEENENEISSNNQFENTKNLEDVFSTADQDKFDELNSDSTEEIKKTTKSKKLSWEEYKKLEDKE